MWIGGQKTVELVDQCVVLLSIGFNQNFKERKVGTDTSISSGLDESEDLFCQAMILRMRFNKVDQDIRIQCDPPVPLQEGLQTCKAYQDRRTLLM